MAMGSEARKCKIRKKGRQGPPPGKPRVWSKSSTLKSKAGQYWNPLLLLNTSDLRYSALLAIWSRLGEERRRQSLTQFDAHLRSLSMPGTGCLPERLIPGRIVRDVQPGRAKGVDHVEVWRNQCRIDSLQNCWNSFWGWSPLTQGSSRDIGINELKRTSLTSRVRLFPGQDSQLTSTPQGWYGLETWKASSYQSANLLSKQLHCASCTKKSGVGVRWGREEWMGGSEHPNRFKQGTSTPHQDLEMNRCQS